MARWNCCRLIAHIGIVPKYSQVSSLQCFLIPGHYTIVYIIEKKIILFLYRIYHVFIEMNTCISYTCMSHIFPLFHTKSIEKRKKRTAFSWVWNLFPVSRTFWLDVLSSVSLGNWDMKDLAFQRLSGKVVKGYVDTKFCF